eukprot:scaffold4421_cov21-Tisochrysis_lutea.AAC.1
MRAGPRAVPSAAYRTRSTDRTGCPSPLRKELGRRAPGRGRTAEGDAGRGAHLLLLVVSRSPSSRCTELLHQRLSPSHFPSLSSSLR